MTELERIRRAAGWSRDRAAVAAGVSYPTARLYECDPRAVRDEGKRQQLDRVYGRLRLHAPARSSEPPPPEASGG